MEEKQRLLGLFPYIIDMAVPIFMIISGYVFSNSYHNKGICHFEDAYDFLLVFNRLMRYTIPFLIAYAIELIYFYLVGNKMGLKEIMALFFTGGYGPGSYYYPEMIQITFFLPVILFSMKKNPSASIVFWFVFNAFYEYIRTITGLEQGIYRLSLFRYSFLVAFGCFMYIQKGKKMNRAILAITFVVGFVYILCTKYLGYETKIINNDWRGTSFMAALYIAPIVMLIVYKFGSFSFRPLELIGKASYNIFLTQLVYYSTASGLIIKFTDSIAIHLIFNVIICVLVGRVFYLFENKITKRVIQWSDSLINKIRKILNPLEG